MFDRIYEEIAFPWSLNSDYISTVSVSDKRIITTSQRTNFNLFWLEVNDWEESFVDFVLESEHQVFESEQLVTVPNPVTKRLVKQNFLLNVLKLSYDKYFSSDMTNDTILLMLSAVTYFCRRLRIYQYIVKNESMVLDYLENFRDTCNMYRMVFPPVIHPNENGKFIFSPQETSQIRRQFWSFDAIEVWEKNTTLTRSPSELPINFPREMFSLWIVQL